MFAGIFVYMARWLNRLEMLKWLMYDNSFEAFVIINFILNYKNLLQNFLNIIIILGN